MNTNQKFNLSRQITHQYRAAWSYLNQSEDVGTARALMSKRFGKEDPHGESSRKLVILSVTSKEPEDKIREGIEDTLRYECRCEHDCCGHSQTYVSKARRIRSGLWAIILSSYANV